MLTMFWEIEIVVFQNENQNVSVLLFKTLYFHDKRKKYIIFF